ncbi:hypothetical protein [Natrinema halophilum]|uniref:Uncharacterized protein n=1 Tax=Natrinema halophilum TaxID=1699371 RepID=A0A7D5KKE6_9EURY|nr:hypothetical protein [Natrinema halophilum]QLG48958.1 hypothetical protein HYG82_08880 [Natrinema halophilum]
MGHSIEQAVGIVCGIVGLSLIGLVSVLFLPGYTSGIGPLAVTGASGIVFVGVGVRNFDEQRRRIGAAVAAIGSAGTAVAAVYILVAAGESTANLLAVGAAGVAVLSLSLSALTSWDLCRYEPRFVELGGISATTASVILADLPPDTDEPFRTLFFAFGCLMAVYGVLILVAAFLVTNDDTRISAS